MAYDPSQRRIVAHELARSGGNVPVAMARLRSEYETLRGIGKNTIHRMLKSPGFAELVAERAKIIADAEAQAAIESERVRTRREQENVVLDRLARDELMLDQARTRLEEVLRDSQKVNPRLAVWAFETLAKITDRRKERALPALGSDRQAHDFVEAVVEILNADLGPVRAEEEIKRIKVRYLGKVELRERTEKEVAKRIDQEAEQEVANEGNV